MTIGSIGAGFDRFAGYSGGRMDGGASSPSGVSGGYAAAGENVNDPQRAGGAWNAEDGKGASYGKEGKSKKGRFDKNDCETCKNRSYQDGSNDPGVSFKAPTKMTPEQAATAVMGHEMEHVTRNQAEAKASGREVISQSVTLHTGICPECGRTYIAGGETRTVTGERKSKDENGAGKQADLFRVGMEDPSRQNGGQLNAVA